MSVGLSEPRNPDHIPEHSLCVLRKDSRTAEARVRMVPAGPELHIYYNGQFLRSEVVRDGRNVGDVAEEAKAGWLARGMSSRVTSGRRVSSCSARMLRAGDGWAPWSIETRR